MRGFRFLYTSLAPTALASFALAATSSSCGSSNKNTTVPEEDAGQEDAGGRDATTDRTTPSSDASMAKDSSAVDSPSADGADSSGSLDSASEASDSSFEDSGGEDSGTSDAGSDAESGAPDSESSIEAGPCSVDGVACALDGSSGLCSSQACAPCVDPSSDSACSRAYGDGGTGYICSAGACIPGNCHADSDCNGGICGLVTPQFCGGCRTDADCQNDATYGVSTICNTTSKTCVSSACTTVASPCANPGDICCPGGNGNACVPGNCCSDAQCSGNKPVCNTNTDTCAACDSLGTGSTFVVVDPVNGKDIVGNGLGTVGGTVQDGACAFKTITYALGHLGSGPDGGPTTVTTVMVLPTGTVSAATNGEQFPITVPAGMTIEGNGNPVTVSEVATGNGSSTGVAFTLASAGSTLSNLVIDGATTGVHGVRATTGSTAATTLVNVEVRNFAAAGIRVELSGKLTINSGTNAHNNGVAPGTELCGLHVTGQAQAFITGGAVPIQFNQNTANGILVDGAGAVTISGAPGSGTSGSVVANANMVDGIEVHQTVEAANTITGLVAAGNGQDGARLFGGSSVQIRGSVFVGNTNNGVNIEPEGAGANTDLVSAIDLGTSLSPGNNVFFQSAASPNATGICLNLDQGKSQTLEAQGNTWEGADGGVVVCVGPADAGSLGTLTENASKQCSGGVDIGGTGLSPAVTATSNGINVAGCSCSSGGICE